MLELLLNAEVCTPEPLGRRHILIAAGRVAWIGKDAPKLPASLGVAEHDLGGERLIPGLIDGHVHVTGGGGEAGPHTRVPPVPLSSFTAGGTTTVVASLAPTTSPVTPPRSSPRRAPFVPKASPRTVTPAVTTSHPLRSPAPSAATS